VKATLQIFNDNRLGSIRAMVIDKEPYFVGKDVAEALGYSNPRDALDNPTREVVYHGYGKEKEMVPGGR